MNLINLIKELNHHKNDKYAKTLTKLFKNTNDKFIGVPIPTIRQIVKKYMFTTSLDDIKNLLKSKIHEQKVLSLILLVELFKKNNDVKYVIFYMNNIKYIDNWDLVDISAYNILGRYIYKNGKTDNNINYNALYEYSKSKNIWIRRISIVATYYFIKKGIFKHTLEITKKFIEDDEPLIHKATGWMLREIGKINENELTKFLDKFFKIMPRTMLRYSIERLSKEKKKHYLSK